MAFAGVQANTLVGPAAGPLMVVAGDLELDAVIGAFDITAADSGALTTDNTTTPANTNAIPAAFGPGEGNWVQADVDAVFVVLNTPFVGANVRLALVSKVLTAGDLVVNVHSTEGIANPTGISVTMLYLHSMVRGN